MEICGGGYILLEVVAIDGCWRSLEVVECSSRLLEVIGGYSRCWRLQEVLEVVGGVGGC